MAILLECKVRNMNKSNLGLSLRHNRGRIERTFVALNVTNEPYIQLRFYESYLYLLHLGPVSQRCVFPAAILFAHWIFIVLLSSES